MTAVLKYEQVLQKLEQWTLRSLHPFLSRYWRDVWSVLLPGQMIPGRGYDTI